MTVLGRERELDLLADLLERTRHGNGGALVLHGAPGVGKSRLLDAARVAAEDFQVLAAAGVQSESDLAFGALASVLHPLLTGLDELPEVQAQSLGAAVGLSGAQVERLACHAGVVSLLAAAARTRPVLVLADDLQWFDTGSRDAILFAARRLQSDPVAFVLAIRDGEFDRVAAYRFARARARGPAGGRGTRARSSDRGRGQPGRGAAAVGADRRQPAGPDRNSAQPEL